MLKSVLLLLFEVDVVEVFRNRDRLERRKEGRTERKAKIA
jgi:hypothetical protein